MPRIGSSQPSPPSRPCKGPAIRNDGFEVIVVAHGDDEGWDVEVSIAGPQGAWSSDARPVSQLRKKYASPMVAIELGKRWACDAIAGNVIGIKLAR